MMDNGKTRILIAEDEHIVAMDLKATLKRLGYFVITTVSTGEDVIDKANAECPDLILMDIILKGVLNGIQAASRISEKQNIPIIYVTASTDKDTLFEAQKTSQFGFIRKPFDEMQLRHQIESALTKFRFMKN